MGWTGYYREPGRSDAGELERQLCGCHLIGGGIIENEPVAEFVTWNETPGPDGQRILYAAVKLGQTREVLGLVVLQEGAGIEGGEYSYKDLAETTGPFYWGAAHDVLEALTPTENRWAKEWRHRCLLQLEGIDPASMRQEEIESDYAERTPR